MPPDSRGGTCPWRFPAAKLVLPEKEHSSILHAGSELLACRPSGQEPGHKPEAQAKGVRKCISLNALRLRFRLVASDFPGIVCILDGDRSGCRISSSGFTAANWAAHCKSSFVRSGAAFGQIGQGHPMRATLHLPVARRIKAVRTTEWANPRRFTGHRPPATLPSRSAIARPRLSPRLPLGTLALFPPLRPGRF